MVLARSVDGFDIRELVLALLNTLLVFVLDVLGAIRYA
jgi:hypothetical protein